MPERSFNGGGGGGGLTLAEVDARINALTPAIVQSLSNQYHGDVADQAALLTLPAQRGDTARTVDTGDIWRLVGTDPTDPADWEMVTEPPQHEDPFISADPFISSDLFIP